MAGEDKRRHVRLPMVVECQVDGISGRGSMRLSDLSLSGCYVDTATGVALGSTVAIAAVLKIYLRELPEPLFPFSLNERVAYSGNYQA